MENVLYIETEILLSPNFWRDLNDATSTEFAYTRVSRSNALGAIFSIKNFKSTKFMNQSLEESINSYPNVTDMLFMNLFQDNCPKLMTICPSLSTTESKNLSDDATYGMHKTGIGPPNNHGKSFLLQEIQGHDLKIHL